MLERGKSRSGLGFRSPLQTACRMLLAAGWLSLVASCPKPPPPPPPPPEPPPPEPQFVELLLRQPSPPRLVRGGQPFEPFGAIQCCQPFSTPTATGPKGPPRKPRPFVVDGVAQNSRWPLASESWMDFTHARGANYFHFRMGPFFGDAAHEAEWADIGGPYLGTGPEFNPAFWDKVRALATHAGQMGANVEVDVIDTWYCKHAQGGDQQMPWPAADIEACGRRASAEQERYIRKVVSELTCFANVTWLTDNEGDQIAGATREWFDWVRTVIRDAEQKTSCGGQTLVRLIGTNAPRFGDGPFDYVATHGRAPLTEPFFGKHSSNNERNPAFSPQQEYANFCAARAAGLHWWFWRADMTDADMQQTLALFGQGCGGRGARQAPGTAGRGSCASWRPRPRGEGWRLEARMSPPC